METVLIAGAGIIGLATALELARRGIPVTVLERGVPMQEASWAAAGMLAAEDPENPPALAPLARYSLALYPDFLARIAVLSGIPVPLRTQRTLQIGDAPSQAASLSAELPSHRAESARWLDESSLDPRDLCRALPQAARAAGVRIHEHTAVTGVEVRRDSVVAHTHADAHSGSHFLLACGAWSAGDRIFSPVFLPAGAVLPRKGQAVAVRMPEGLPQLETVIRSASIYLVPRGDGRIVVGATVEDAGFDRTVQPASERWLLETAAALWPPLRMAMVEDAWCGLRPVSIDGLPFLGPACDHAAGRLWIATGHYRNGILLAPGTAHLLASMIETSMIETSVHGGSTLAAASQAKAVTASSPPQSSSPVDCTPYLPSRLTAAPIRAQQTAESMLT